MIVIFFVFMVAAAVTMAPVDQKLPTPPPEPAPVVIEKTVVIECIPLPHGERLERDLTMPFEKRRYLNPTGNPCRKKTVTTIVSKPTKAAPVVNDQQSIPTSIEPSESWEPDILKDEEWP